MKKSTISSLLMLLPVASWAQSAKDSTDMYYQHLRLNEITVTGLTGESRLHEMPAGRLVKTPKGVGKNCPGRHALRGEFPP